MDLMNFQGPNQVDDDDLADFMGEVTFEDLLKDSLDENPDDSQDERRESSIRNKLISKGDKKAKELAALKRVRDRKKNELTGAHWKGPLGPRKVVNKSKWKWNGCFPLDNQPLPRPRQTFAFPTLSDTGVLEYNSFMPTGEEKFIPYKLLLYRGWYNDYPEHDDRHRFVYLAENKPEEPAVGDCFVRLEDIHKRMNGTSTDYTADCAVAISQRGILYYLHNGDDDQMAEAQVERDALIQQGKWLLRFRCWAVDGLPSVNHELLLCNRLFEDVFEKNDMYDHFQVFGVWAELLRKSQGDKLGAKDFFGRYWDAKIPNDDRQKFKNGFKIVVGSKYFQNHRAGQLDYHNFADRNTVRAEVLDGVQRAVNAPRLKFKPPIVLGNIVFVDELANLGITPATLAPRFDQAGWRYLDDHPGGLYGIVVDGPVREVLYHANERKRFWELGYGVPDELLAKQLNDRLDKCRPHTESTTTRITTTLLNNMVKKRNPTQDKCVANAGYSANLYYNVIGMIDDNEIIGHVNETRHMSPLNRETCLLFQSILDKSLENLCWGWNCWDLNKVVEEALLESTGVDDDQQEKDQAEVKERLAKELEERDQLVET
ncbi:hypothetical protein FPHYL_5087 [Fusarium phyllophilum]|uniref:Uncharacterized protein n=1 Tax=Fusarium phyllophilum TaxID=47803 RepID=A0A8H5JYU1_9HYPO|nr:hypothetical protein FPHYL_5087 [Fusarium phyllophilum]